MRVLVWLCRSLASHTPSVVNVHSAGLPPPGDVLLLLSELPFPNEKIFHLTTIDTIIAIGELWDADSWALQ